MPTTSPPRNATRRRSPDTGHAEAGSTPPSPYRTRLAEVVAVRDVLPHLRSITFRGPTLADLDSDAPDTFLYVLLPPVGSAVLSIDESFSFDGFASLPVETKPVGAYYTVRRRSPGGDEVEMFFVLHDDEDDADPSATASGWVRHAKVGDPAALWGPRTTWEPPAGTDTFVLVADETGLPATARIIETLTATTAGRTTEVSIRVIAEADGDDWHALLDGAPGVEVTWVHRNGAAPGTTTLLADAVRAMPWPTGRLYVWGGGESRALTAVRKYVRHERGLPAESVSLVAYWRHTA